MSLPTNLRYTDTHEWVRFEDDDLVYVGITDFAQKSLGDIVFVELPEVGRVVTKGDPVAVVESVKAASDIYAPLSGEIVEVNEALEAMPQNLNEIPYDSWIFAIKPSNDAEKAELLDEQEYLAIAEES
jgi:glycine cleavage system H protein